MKTKVIASILCALLFLAVSRAAAADDKPVSKDKTWLIEATPSPATVSPGGGIKLEVTIKNITGTNQTFDLPSYGWWAHSDNPSVIFPAWPKRTGLGPVVIFKTVTVAPGQAYTNTWTATIAPATPPGELTFRMGFPLHRDSWGDYYWSSDIKLQVAQPQASPAAFQIVEPRLTMTVVPTAKKTE